MFLSATKEVGTIITLIYLPFRKTEKGKSQNLNPGPWFQSPRACPEGGSPGTTAELGPNGMTFGQGLS